MGTAVPAVAMEEAAAVGAMEAAVAAAVVAVVAEAVAVAGVNSAHRIEKRALFLLSIIIHIIQNLKHK